MSRTHNSPKRWLGTDAVGTDAESRAAFLLTSLSPSVCILLFGLCPQDTPLLFVDACSRRCNQLLARYVHACAMIQFISGGGFGFLSPSPSQVIRLSFFRSCVRFFFCRRALLLQLRRR